MPRNRNPSLPPPRGGGSEDRIHIKKSNNPIESLGIPLKSARHSPPWEGLGEVYEDISIKLWFVLYQVRTVQYGRQECDDIGWTSGGAERVGLDGAFVKVKLANGEKKQIMHDIPEHTEGVKFIFSLLTDPEIGVIKSLSEIDAVGHRMVHGGEKFNKSVILTDEVLKEFEKCSDLAPLHNPANLKGVNAVKELMPGLPQVGVFDTAFHQTMPPKAYTVMCQPVPASSLVFLLKAPRW